MTMFFLVVDVVLSGIFKPRSDFGSATPGYTTVGQWREGADQQCMETEQKLEFEHRQVGEVSNAELREKYDEGRSQEHSKRLTRGKLLD